MHRYVVRKKEENTVVFVSDLEGLFIVHLFHLCCVKFPSEPMPCSHLFFSIFSCQYNTGKVVYNSCVLTYEETFLL